MVELKSLEVHWSGSIKAVFRRKSYGNLLDLKLSRR